MLKSENVELKVPISIGNDKRDNCIFDGKREQHRNTTHILSELQQKITITHPFHPRYSEKFTFHSYGRPRGKIEIVTLLDDTQTLLSVPLSWTDACAEDVYKKILPGHNWFRIPDLVRLRSLIDESILNTEGQS